MKNHLPLVILLACAGVFAYGLVQLFELRFEAGDVYPPYSTLRADPLGTMALYESLGKVPGLSVRRDFSASNRLPEEPDTAYVHLAAMPGEWEGLPADLNTEVRDFLARGGRLIITYFPQTGPIYRSEMADEDQTNALKPAPIKAKAANIPPGEPREKNIEPKGKEPEVSLNDDWGFHEGYKDLEPDGLSYAPATVLRKADLELPRSLQWHSGLIFTNCGIEWRTIYARGVYPVVIERQFGRGSVVIASDSFFVSNEAMLKDRHADLLAWLFGANRQIVFDEAHFGIIESPGVAGLMRKYHLQGLAAGLLLLAGLFIWKNATSLVPPHTDEPVREFVAGKDAATGFVNLLRRNISAREVLGVCFAEWKKSAAPSGKFPAARLQQAEALFQSEDSLPKKSRDPVAAYKRISETLGNRKSQL
jgi:hypothetical protein